ncbi:MAG: response regulator transcription factor [Anaerolineales bacterium]|nr:response regulator transcription factor [Anaerolineales bacterium]
MSTRLFIVDEYEPVRKALAERLDQSASLSVVGHASVYEEAVEAISDLRPDIVLIEVKRKDGMGLELTRQIASMPEAPHLVVLTSYQKSWEEQAAARAGAVTYLLKELDSQELIRKIEELAAR